MNCTNNNGPRRITKARALRKNQTPAEKVMWERLRNRRLEGFKFRRQQIIDEKIVDFFCPEKRLVIELDGLYHENPMQQIKDAQREEYLNQCGLRVIRFTNNMVFDNLEEILEEIINHLTNNS